MLPSSTRKTNVASVLGKPEIDRGWRALDGKDVAGLNKLLDGSLAQDRWVVIAGRNLNLGSVAKTGADKEKSNEERKKKTRHHAVVWAGKKENEKNKIQLSFMKTNKKRIESKIYEGKYDWRTSSTPINMVLFIASLSHYWTQSAIRFLKPKRRCRDV